MLVREKTDLPEWRRADTEGKKPGRSIELLFPGFCSIQNKGEENGSKTEEEQPDRMDLSDRSRPHRDRVGVFHEAVGRIQKQEIYDTDGTDNSAGDLPAVDSSENTAPRDRICSLDRTWHRVHHAVRDNRVRRKPRQKEDAVHDHGRGRGNRAEALFIERIEAAFALGERLLVK